MLPLINLLPINLLSLLLRLYLPLLNKMMSRSFNEKNINGPNRLITVDYYFATVVLVHNIVNGDLAFATKYGTSMLASVRDEGSFI